MNNLGQLLNNFLATVCNAVGELARILFDWLPSDPFRDVLQNNPDIGLGIAWLNWLVPLDFLGILFNLLIALFLPFAGYQLFKVIAHYILEIVPG